MTCGIYKITNLTNDKCYIGQSRNIYKRWKTHKQPSSWDSHPNKVLYKAFKKYGIDNFVFEILKECTPMDIDRCEIEYISKFDSYKNGYNGTLGGKGYKLDEDTYFKNKLKNMYEIDLDTIIGKFKPLYITTEDAYDYNMFIHSKKNLNKIIKERSKRYSETFEYGQDYVMFNMCNDTHKYIILAKVNRYLLDNINDLQEQYFNGVFTKGEYDALLNILEDNVYKNERDIDLINYEDINESVFIFNKTQPLDSIYDLIPDYDELGGDEYFEGCYF